MIAITISGIECAPCWETLQTLLREMTKDPTLQITDAKRRDGGCDYRAKGFYFLTARRNIKERPSDGEQVQICLSIE